MLSDSKNKKATKIRRATKRRTFVASIRIRVIERERIECPKFLSLPDNDDTLYRLMIVQVNRKNTLNSATNKGF